MSIATSESGDTDAEGDTAKDAEEDDAEAEADENDEEEEEEGVNVIEEPAETPDAETVKEKRVEAKKPLQMIGVQLMKDLDQVSTSSKKSRRKSRVIEVLRFSVHSFSFSCDFIIFLFFIFCKE